MTHPVDPLGGYWKGSQWQGTKGHTVRMIRIPEIIVGGLSEGTEVSQELVSIGDICDDIRV